MLRESCCLNWLVPLLSCVFCHLMENDCFMFDCACLSDLFCFLIPVVCCIVFLAHAAHWLRSRVLGNSQQVSRLQARCCAGSCLGSLALRDHRCMLQFVRLLLLPCTLPFKPPFKPPFQSPFQKPFPFVLGSMGLLVRCLSTRTAAGVCLWAPCCFGRLWVTAHCSDRSLEAP